MNDLVQKKLVMVQNFGSRVDKYQQRFCNTQFAQLKLSSSEFAIVCLLFLRGPQTPGELKAHSGRLHEFADATEVEATLEALLERPDGAVLARLPREPRRKDHCYAHLLGGPLESATKEDLPARPVAMPRADDRVASLAPRVESLERELRELKQALGVQ